MASGSSGRASVKAVVGDGDFQNELVVAGDKLVVVDFFATWCGPCKQIAPIFASFSEKYSSAVFLKLDVDICRNTARRYEVAAMPTFVFFQNREKIHVVKGADSGALETAIIQHLDSSEGESRGPPSALSIPGQINLFSLLDKKGSECLNDSNDHPLDHALDSTSSEEFLESDCDEQLIISLGFLQPIKLHSLQITAPLDGTAPKGIKIFINQPQALDFDQAEQYKCVQELSLTEDDVLENVSIPLQFVKYQNVQNITLFIRDNQSGGEVTTIQHLALFGSPLDATKMSDFKRVAGEKGERHS